MAETIINNQNGNSHTKEQASSSRYRLSTVEILDIRSQAPCPNGDPSATFITNTEVESMRQAFIKANGDDGLSLD